jgi:hypothetical protein
VLTDSEVGCGEASVSPDPLVDSGAGEGSLEAGGSLGAGAGLGVECPELPVLPPLPSELPCWAPDDSLLDPSEAAPCGTQPVEGGGLSAAGVVSVVVSVLSAEAVATTATKIAMVARARSRTRHFIVGRIF